MPRNYVPGHAGAHANLSVPNLRGGSNAAPSIVTSWCRFAAALGERWRASGVRRRALASPMNAMEGQSETQQREAAEECDSLAKTSSRYGRGTEALAWLLVPPAAIALISTAIVVELLDLLTFRLFRLQDATRNAVTKIEKATRIEGNSSWSQYFVTYRACMSSRGLHGGQVTAARV